MSGRGISLESSDSPRLTIDGVDAMNECIERMFLACRNSLMVRAPRLDFEFYFSPSFQECCEAIVVREMRNELLFLVEDEQYLMRANSRLITLARRFSSYVRIRVIPKEYIEQQETFIVCDDSAYLHQPNIDHPRGVMHASDRGRARQLGVRFKDLWERSTQPFELFTTGL